MIEITGNRTKSVCNKKRRFVDRENRRFPTVSYAGLRKLVENENLSEILTDLYWLYTLGGYRQILGLLLLDCRYIYISLTSLLVPFSSLLERLTLKIC